MTQIVLGRPVVQARNSSLPAHWRLLTLVAQQVLQCEQRPHAIVDPVLLMPTLAVSQPLPV